jgi:hypothetical protein
MVEVANFAFDANENVSRSEDLLCAQKWTADEGVGWGHRSEGMPDPLARQKWMVHLTPFRRLWRPFLSTS